MFTKKAFIQVAFAGLLLSASALAQHDHSQMAGGVAVSGLDYAFEGPDQLETGYVTLTFTNSGKELHHLQLARLNDGVTLEQFTTALQQGEQAAMPLIEFVGGVGLVMPGQTASTTVHLEKPGTYLELCFVPDANGVPHLALGMIRPIEVVATTTVAEAPEADVVVNMTDFAFTIPGELPAGEQTWEVVNHGVQPHELMLGKIKEGKTMEDVMAYLQSGAFGPDMPLELMGGAQALATEHSSFLTFALEPGNYVTLCFIPDPASGLPHIALGMVSHFTVGEKTAQH